MPSYYLTSYRPIVITKQGRAAVEKYGAPHFVDASCRREPDFQSKFPSITALCRRGMFAPRLYEDDVAVCITVKGNYLSLEERHWRLVAILKVLKRYESHENAADWYRSNGLPLPSNCMVSGNPPLCWEMTAGTSPPTRFGDLSDPQRIIKKWDATYRRRARDLPVFLICEYEFLELNTPPIITDAIMKDIFGRIPGTRTPPKISIEEFNKLKYYALNQALPISY